MAPWRSRANAPMRASNRQAPAQPLPHWLEPGNTLGDMLAAQKAHQAEYGLQPRTPSFAEAVPAPAWSQECYTMLDRPRLQRHSMAAVRGMPLLAANGQGYSGTTSEWPGTARGVNSGGCVGGYGMVAMSHPQNLWNGGYVASPDSAGPDDHEEKRKAGGANGPSDGRHGYLHLSGPPMQPQQQQSCAPPGEWRVPHANGKDLAAGVAPMQCVGTTIGGGRWEAPQRDSVAEALGLLAPAPPKARAWPSMAVAPASCRDDAIVLPPYLQVTNTFLNARPVRSASLERVYVERKVRSVPGSRQASPPPNATYESTVHDAEYPFAIATPSGSSMGTTPQRTPRQLPQGYLGEQLVQYVQTMPDHSGMPANCINDSSRRSYSQSHSASSAEPYMTGLVPTKLSAGGELPSKGSALHQWGACKPCAFYVKDGCANGLDCQFCHLCENGEKKRRKKERLSIRREMREKVRSSQRGGNRW